MMKKPLPSDARARFRGKTFFAGTTRAFLATTMAFLAACTGTLGEQGGATGGSGSGAAPGAGGGSSNGGSGGKATTGTGASPGSTGGATGTTADVAVVVENPIPYAPAPGILRRLTRSQFRNAIKDVFGTDLDVSTLDADSWNGRFASVGASTVATTDSGVEQYHAAIESAANAIFSDATKTKTFLGCTPTGQSTDTCVRGFLQKVGQRAWRRPLESTELDRLTAIATSATTALGSATEGARWATVALFESPNFIYRPELGTTTNGKLKLNGYEVASRLSFLLWNSLPDQTLLDQAAAGMLGTPDGIKTAATRMLGTAAGREAVGNFADELMRTDRLITQAKDPSLFPEYTPALQTAMVRDMRETWMSVALDDQANIFSLFTTNKAYVNADLAKLYGLDTTGLTSSTFQMKTLPADGPRIGVLSKAGVLSQFANQKSGSPTLRGKFIREALNCQTVPPPPGDVNTAAIDLPTDVPMTKRQRLEMHRAQATCSGCHSLMDPMGLPLESFDAIGKYRTTDNGLPVDPTSTFEGKPVADARGLGMAASDSVGVAQCFVRSFYSYAVGHVERDEDGAVLNSLAASFKGAGFKMKDLILAVVSHDAFTSVAPQP